MSFFFVAKINKRQLPENNKGRSVVLNLLVPTNLTELCLSVSEVDEPKLRSSLWLGHWRTYRWQGLRATVRISSSVNRRTYTDSDTNPFLFSFPYLPRTTNPKLHTDVAADASHPPTLTLLLMPDVHRHLTLPSATCPDTDTLSLPKLVGRSELKKVIF
jgi:hypothetical protein